MAKGEQRIANKRERRQGREVTQRWTTAVRPRRKRVITGGEEEWEWFEDTNQARSRKTKEQRHLGEDISLVEEIALDLTDENPVTSQEDIPLPDGNRLTGQEEEWFEDTEDIRPQTSWGKRPWLLAILILPAVAVVTLLVGFYKTYKRISLAHP